VFLNPSISFFSFKCFLLLSVPMRCRRVCPVWNDLSYDVVNACSVGLSAFKRKLGAVNLDLYSC